VDQRGIANSITSNTEPAFRTDLLQVENQIARAKCHSLKGSGRITLLVQVLRLPGQPAAAPLRLIQHMRKLLGLDLPLLLCIKSRLESLCKQHILFSRGQTLVCVQYIVCAVQMQLFDRSILGPLSWVSLVLRAS
jgi:hypothetical protein